MARSSCSIFVGNLPYDAQEDELRDLFSQVGHVTSVRVVMDRDTKTPKGYAFCDFSDSASVQAAIDKLNNVDYNGRKIRIDSAQKELHGRGGPPALGDRDGGGGFGGGFGGGGGGGGGFGGPMRRGAPPGAAGAPMDAPTPNVPTIAERLARMKAQELEQKAKAASAEQAERAEIGRLMETLTPQQVIHILGEMQRLTVRAPEVARALIAENMQLALALEHAEFLAGMTEASPLPTEPEVKERARSVREKLWGTPVPPAPPHPSKIAEAFQQGLMPMGAMPGLLALPGMPPPMAMMPFGAVPGAMPGVFQPPPPSSAPPNPGMGLPAAAPLPASVADLPQLLAAAANDEAARKTLMERLVKLSPAEIDTLPHDQKVRLLQFVQQPSART